MKTQYITVNKDVAGGSPVIVGTRIPTERLQYLVQHGYTEENIKKEFPGLSIKKVRGALNELLEIGQSQIVKSA